MYTTGCSSPISFDANVITRSDYAPTNNERYGEWARKFFGSGCHQRFKDLDTPIIYTLAFGMPAATATHH